MRAVVVYESMFGNTAEIAQAIADGLADGGIAATVASSGEASVDTGVDADLLVIGAPTHGLTLSTPRSRAAARQQGAAVDPIAPGVREWLARALAPPTAGAVAAFDTRARSMRHWPGSAARKESRILRRHGAVLADRPTSFYVTGAKGPLAPGETGRAHEWGQALARQVHERGDTGGRAAS
ncbi:MAG TPA: flavodoxin domain-containing protein [Marmoricola sp.]|nr:flavodoxin domain-containing protein [Marmoricola sp.]